MEKYTVLFHPEAAKELRKLDGSVVKLVLKQIKKLELYPLAGDLLGNKHGYDLSNYRKLYVNNKKIRVIYTVIENQILVKIIAIGNREAMEVYSDANNRKE